MIARNSHRPAFVPLFQLRQKFGRIIYIQHRIEHRRQAGKLILVIVMIYLHAAQINELFSSATGLIKDLECLTQIAREHSAPLNIQRIGLQGTLSARLRQSYSI